MIVVSNIHEECQDDDIYELFSDFGEIKNLHLNLDRETGYTKGYCFIEHYDGDEAETAVKETNGTELLGQKIDVSFAFMKPDTPVKRSTPKKP